MAPALFVVNNLLAAAVAYGAGAMVMRGREPWRRGLAMMAGFPVVMLLVVLTLGTVGRLSAAWATVLLAGLVGLVAIPLRLVPHGSGETASALALGNGKTSPTWTSWIALGLLGAFGGVIFVKTCIVGVQFVTDDLSYHAPAVVPWLIDGHITLTPFNYHAYFPLNAEVFSLWFMLPFHADALASVGGLYWAALAVMATVALSLALESSVPAGLLSAGLLLAAPTVAGTAVHFAAPDLAGPAMLLAAIAFVIPSSANSQRRCDWADALYGGLACGFAAGCKVSLAPVCVVLLIWFVLCRQRGARLNARLIAIALFLLGVTFTGSYWNGRNLVLTGNPVFPAQFGPFDGPFQAVHQARTTLMSWILAAPTDANQWWYLVKGHLDWPADLAFFCVVGYVGAVTAMVLRKSSPGPARPATALLLLAGGVMIALYPFTPFSGTDDAASGPLRVALRFLIAPFAVGLIFFSSVASDTRGYRWLWWILPVNGALIALHKLHPITPIVALAGAVVTVAAWRSFGTPILRACRRPVIVAGALTTGLCALAAWAPRKQELTNELLRHYGDAGQPIGAGWSTVARLPAGARIAWFGKAAGQYYPLYGRQLHLRPVPVSGDGKVERPLHERWREDPGNVPWWTPRTTFDFEHLMPNLAAAGIQYVFVTAWDGSDQPPQQSVLAKSVDADVIYDDGYSSVYRLAPGTGTNAGR